jgi:hypothetical protein
MKSTKSNSAKQVLNDALSELVGALKSTKAFVIKEAPSVLKEIVTYHRVLYTIQFLFALSFIAGAFILFHNGYCVPHDVKFSEYNQVMIENGYSFLAYAMWVGSAVSLIVGLCSTGCMFEDFLKIWFAPKVFLIEYIKRQIR